MQNMERFKGKSLHEAAAAWLDTQGLPHTHLWTKETLAEFTYWLFEDEKFIYNVTYTVPGNNYDQIFRVNAVDDKHAVAALMAEIPNADVHGIFPIETV